MKTDVVICGHALILSGPTPGGEHSAPDPLFLMQHGLMF